MRMGEVTYDREQALDGALVHVKEGQEAVVDTGTLSILQLHSVYLAH